jgi:hypothetical protein
MRATPDGKGIIVTAYADPSNPLEVDAAVQQLCKCASALNVAGEIVKDMAPDGRLMLSVTVPTFSYSGVADITKKQVAILPVREISIESPAKPG